MRAYQSKGYKILLLVVTPYLSYQKAMLEKYGDIVLLPTGTPHTPQPHGNDRRGDPPAWPLFSYFFGGKEEEALDRQAMLDSARDFHLLSLTDAQVVSQHSGFGLVGAMTKLTTRHVMYQVGSGDDATRDCGAEAEGEPVSRWEHRWSGL